MPSLRRALDNFSALIVTGGSSGIGKSFIELCSIENLDVLICNLSRRKPALDSGKLKLRHFACDLSAPGDIERAALGIEAALAAEAPAGRVLLINNSGFGSYGPFPAPGLERQLGMIDVNVRAVVHLTARLLPLLKARGGAILTVASTAAFQPIPGMAVYAATKAFVMSWSLALGEELRGAGVRVIAVCPGPTETDFSRRAGLPVPGTPDWLAQTSEDVVRESLRALAAGRSRVVTGRMNRLAALASGLFPGPLVARLAGRVVAGRRPTGFKG
jgi:short-subunit dehydrogenase